MNNISVMIKPASSLCDMRCRYCFYGDVSRRRGAPSTGFMSDETAEAVLDHVFTPLRRGDRLNLTFQGGEPTLRGLPFFEKLLAGADRRAADRGVDLSCSLQTNGLGLDDDWCAFLARKNVLTGLSMDVLERVHDDLRPDAAGQGTWKALKQTRRRLEASGAAYNIVAVLSRPLSRHPERVWRFIADENIEYIQFIPCLGPLGGEYEPWTLTPDDFAHFYIALFGAWRAAFLKGEYHSVKLFDDLVNLLAWGARGACGLTGECAPQLVVEADGSVYPCDFYALDEWRCGDLSRQPLDAVVASPVRAAFAARGREKHAECADCEFAPYCGGGCPRQSASVCFGPGGGPCGYRRFLQACFEPLRQIALDVRRG